MKIIQIIPGFGGTFYCGNCLRDSALVQSLRREGHDALTLPMYLPLTINGKTDIKDIPVFYGAVSIYLKQNYPLFRNMPGWLERFFNSSPILKFAAHKAGSTRAKGLEEMTESMLRGMKGYQHRELEELVRFLQKEKPDVVHLSNALLLGLAEEIREKTGVPVVYSLQDEDVWVDAMRDDYRGRIWDLMKQKVPYVDAFIAVSDYFAGIMGKKMEIPVSKMYVIHIGVNPDAYDPILPSGKSPAIGYLSRIHEENGFGLLVDAFTDLKKKTKFANLQLHATGGMTGDDRPFFNQQMKKLRKAGLSDHVFIYRDFRQGAVKDFFRHVTVLSVPVLKGEAFGLYQLEALASGVPLVQPEVGAFPEVISTSGGGVTYHPNSSSELASTLEKVLDSPGTLDEMSKRGVESIHNHFNCSILATKMVEVYKQIMKK